MCIYCNVQSALCAHCTLLCVQCVFEICMRAHNPFIRWCLQVPSGEKLGQPSSPGHQDISGANPKIQVTKTFLEQPNPEFSLHIWRKCEIVRKCTLPLCWRKCQCPYFGSFQKTLCHINSRIRKCIPTWPFVVVSFLFTIICT